MNKKNLYAVYLDQPWISTPIWQYIESIYFHNAYNTIAELKLHVIFTECNGTEHTNSQKQTPRPPALYLPGRRN